jgi:dynein heavy chain, axonemal
MGAMNPKAGSFYIDLRL